MDYKEQQQFFQQAYDLKDKRLAAGYGWPLEVDPQVAAFLKIVKETIPTGRALDLGCGQGRHAMYFARQGFETWGVDYIPSVIEEATQTARERKITNVHFSTMDILALDFPPAHFDLVLDWSVFDHIKPVDWDQYTQGVTKVLKPGGFLMLTEFSANDERITNPFDNSVESENYYGHFFRPDEIEKLFGHDFEVITTTETMLTQPPAFLMLNVLLKRRV